MKVMANGEIFDILEFAGKVGGGVTAQEVNTTDAQAGITTPRADATKLLVGTSFLPDGTIDVYYDQTLQAVGGNPVNYSWTLNQAALPPGLNYNSSGQIYGTPTTEGTYSFVVRVIDGTDKDTQALSITIHPSGDPVVLDITTTTLPSGIENVYYGTTLSASGGKMPYLWSKLSGSLPNGLGLDDGGTISGRPTTEGTFIFEVKVMDAGGAVETQPLSITIRPKPTQNFTISGYVKKSDGNALQGVLMRGLPGAPTTGADGLYTATVPEGWEGTVTPFIEGYTFYPASQYYPNITKHETLDFTAYPPVDRFEFDTIQEEQAVGVPFRITITAVDSKGDLIKTYSDTNTLSDSTGTISPTSTGVFINGIWTGDVTISATQLGVTITTSGRGKTGESDAFNVIAGAAEKIRIEDAADGTGTEVGAMTIYPGSSFTVYAISRDAGDNFVANVAATWSLIDETDGVVDDDLIPAADDNKSATFYGHEEGTANIKATHALGDDTTGTITVTSALLDDSYEENDDFENAAKITLGTSYPNLVYLDEDWYKVEITAANVGKDLKVHIWGTSYPDPNQRKDLDFGIWNSLEKMLSFNLSGSDDETVYISDLAEGWYFIGINLSSQNGAVYTMTVEVGDGSTFGIGYISGTVEDEQGNKLENILVELYGEPFNWDISRPLITTDSNGYYKIGYIPGDYKVRFNLMDFSQYGYIWAPDLNYIGEYYDDKSSSAEASILSVAEGTTIAGKNAKLALGGMISGTVTYGVNGIENVAVRVRDLIGSSISLGYTNGNGQYTFNRIPTGYFKVYVYPPSAEYGVEWYDDKPSLDDADPVFVAAGKTTSGIDFQLEEGGRIAGKVTNSQEVPIPIQGVTVGVYDPTQTAQILLNQVSTNENGEYSIGRLPDGYVKIRFDPPGFYSREWYNDKRYFGEADLVRAIAGQTTPDIDAQLEEGGAITGHVTDSLEHGLYNINVMCVNTESCIWYSANTNVAGNYGIYHIPPGNYKVRFRADYGNYVTEWHANKNFYEEANTVSVVAGENTIGINVELLENGGYITGTVTANGAGVEGVRVRAHDSTFNPAISWAFTDPIGNISWAFTDSNGNYSIPRMPTCSAKIFFDTDFNNLNYASKWYDNKSSHDVANKVQVTQGATTSDINADLAARPLLSITTTVLSNGTVGMPYGAPLQAEGGRWGYHWSLAPDSDPLPDGLSLHGNGVIDGTPTTTNTFNFTVQVIDSSVPTPQTDTRNLSITIGTYTGTGYLISGTVTFNGSRLPGVAMNGLPGNPVTNDSGKYMVVVSPGWSGGATPTLRGYCFNPVNRTYTTVASQFQNEDYTASVGHDISGTVTLTGSLLQGVLMGGLPGNPRTNASGFYTAAVPSGWLGIVTPTLPGFAFNPANRSYTSVTSHQIGQNYAANYPGGQDDAYEQNDNFATASVISLGTTYTDLVLLDEDWFKVYVSAADAGKILKVHLKGTSYPDPTQRKDLDFLILNSSGKVLSYNDSGGDDETAYICDVAPGWYYIGHRYLAPIGAIYSLSVEIGTNFGIGYIEGRVTDELGHGIENVYVELYGEPFNWDICRPLITTDASGYYKVGFIPGNYTVRLNLLNNYHRDPYYPDVNYIGKAYNSNEVIALVAGMTVSGINARLVQGGTITGRVTDPQGNGLFGATARVYASDNTLVSLGITNANGYYTAERMRTGNYKVRFRPPGTSYNNYSYEWYENTYSFEDGLPVPVQAGSTTPNINAQLEDWANVEGYIEGRVIDSSGSPIPGVSVTAYDGVGYNLSTAGTNQDGTYRIRWLAAGLVKIFFNAANVAGNYVSEYYPDKFSIGEATPVLVEKRKITSGIDAQLAAGGTITGRVTDMQGNPYPGISVICFDIETDRYYGAGTDVNGNYALKNLPPDDYKVRFRPGAGNYAVEWYNNKSSFSDGDRVSVRVGQTISGIDAQLADNGGFISGWVIDVSGAGIEGVWVYARDSIKQGMIAGDETDADGYFTIPRIPTCQAKVHFNTDLNYLNFVSEYYDNKSSFENADLVAATLGETTENINAALAPIPVLAITTSSLPSGQLAVPYNASLQAMGGRPFYCWSIISGALPHGLTLNSKGEISGTPTATGTLNFTVRVTDSTSPQQEKTQSYSITIGAYSGTDYFISGKVTLSSLPFAGVTLAGLPGPPITNPFGEYIVLVPPNWSGTVVPTLAGYAFDPPRRTYQDVTSSMAGQDYIALVTGSLQISTSSIPSGTRSSAYNTMLYAINGVSPYSWSIFSGRLPDGLTLGASGVISGTPSEGGDFSFTVRVIDSSSPQQYAAKSFGLNIAPAHQDFWTTTYPFGGRINPLGLVLGPDVANTVYLAPQWRGIYKSQNGGSSWSNITDYLQAPFDKSDMRIFLVRSSNEFYTVGHTGIFKSTNAGQNWVRIGMNISNLVTAFSLHTTDGNIMYAGTQNGKIFKSSDGGSNWSGISAGLPAEEIRFIAVDPHDTSKVYAGTFSNGIYKSINDEIWGPVNGALNLRRVEDIAFDPKNISTIYIAGDDATSGGGIFKTTDDGSSWTKLLNISVNWQPGYYIAIDPESTGTIYVASDRSVRKSTDGGTSWTPYTVAESNVTSIVIDMNNPGTLYAGTDAEGIFKSTNGGENWTAVNNGIRAMNFPHSESHSVHVDVNNPSYIYAGSINHGYRSTNGGQTWEKMDHPEWAISSILTYSAKPGEVFTLKNKFWKSANYGTSGSWKDPTSDSFCCVNDGDLGITYYNDLLILYAGVSSSNLENGVYKSNDGGSSWTLLSKNGLTNPAIDTLTIHPTNSNIIFVSTQTERPPEPGKNTRLFRTTDGGNNWEHITCGLPDFININQIVFYPGNPNIMYIGAEVENGGVYKSDNGGGCWYKVLNENVNTVAVHPNNANIVYAGTWSSGGFYISLNGGQTWTQFNNGLPVQPGMESMALDPSNPYHIFIGTTAGVYEATFSFDFAITTAYLPTGIVNEAYSRTIEAVGGTLPYKWQIVSGSLPSGLTLNTTTGEIAGVPTAGGNFSFTVKVTDKDGRTFRKNLTLTIYKMFILNVTANPPGGGSVSKTPDNARYLEGSFVEVSAAPNGGYIFPGWSGDAAGRTPLIHVQMTRDKTITANFTLPIDLPDYYISSSSWPDEASAGDIINDSVNVIIGNQGAGDAYAGDISVGLYLSSDPAITTSDVLLWKGRSSIAALGAGATANLVIDPNLQIPTTVSAENYYIGVLVDDGDAIAEREETNNSASQGITISSAGYNHVQILGGWPYGALYALDLDPVRKLALVENGGLFQVLNVSNPAYTTLRSELSLAPASPTAIKLVGTRAYVASGGAGLKVIDISDSFHPVIIGSCTEIQSARSVDVSGNYAYVPDYHQGLRIINISNPAAPTQTAFLPFSGRTRLIKVSGNYAYVGRYLALNQTQGEQGIQIVDISNPSYPIKKALITLVNSGETDVDSSGHYLFVPVTNNYLRIYDVSDPDEPFEAAVYTGTRSPAAVTIVGNYAYVPDASEGKLVVLDISNPLNPTEVSTYRFTIPVALSSPKVAGNLCFVPSWYDSVRIVDFSNLNAPWEVGYYDCFGLLNYADVSNNHAYIANTKVTRNRLKVLDISNLANITETATLGTDYSIYDLVTSGAYAYLAAYSRGFRSINISNPSYPVEVGANENLPRAQDVAVSGHYAFVADGPNGLRVLDISNPANPVLMSTLKTPGTAYQISLCGKYAYLAAGIEGLRVIDISDPLDPWEVGFYKFSGTAYNVNVAGGYAYVNDNYKLLRIVNVSNPSSPVEVSTFNLYYTYGDIGISGNFIFVPDWTWGLRIIDVSNPASPVEVEVVRKLGTPEEVIIYENRIYVVNRDTGFYVLEFRL